MDDKLLALLHAAQRNTEADKLRWVAFDDETFRTQIGPGMLRIHRGSTKLVDPETYDQFPAPTYEVWVMNGRGQVVTDCEVIGRADPKFQLVDTLFRAARESALGSENVIDEMISILNPDN
jgi:hypothetical protein